MVYFLAASISQYHEIIRSWLTSDDLTLCFNDQNITIPLPKKNIDIPKPCQNSSLD